MYTKGVNYYEQITARLIICFVAKDLRPYAKAYIYIYMGQWIIPCLSKLIRGEKGVCVSLFMNCIEIN